MYVAWSWDIWWYGGSLGQRAMVQSYPMLAFPLAAFVQGALRSRLSKGLGAGVLMLCTCYNLWLTHEAHRGGLLRAGEMTKAYFWKIFGRVHVESEAQFLLDDRDHYDGADQGHQIESWDFENNDTSGCSLPPISGQESLCLGPERQFSGLFPFSIPEHASWLRAEATFRCGAKEWDIWKMAQFRLHLLRDNQIVFSRYIRLYRVLSDGETRRIHIDLKIPSGHEYASGTVDLWNGGSDKALAMDDLTVTAFP